MKVAMPTDGEKGLEENIAHHFGRSPTFTIYDTEKEEVNVIDNQSKHRGGKGNPPELLAEEGVDVMITSNLGRKAVNLFEDLGIHVYCGAGGTVKQAIESWENDELKEATVAEACEEGRHH